MTQTPTRLGYLVPEFPGQTHVFFQREIDALEAHGVVVDVLSTTRPHAALVAHRWADAAMRRTTYLSRPGVAGALRALGALGAALRHGRLRSAAARTDGDARGRLKVLLAAAVLAGRARARGWSHVHVHSAGNSALVARAAAALAPITYSITLHGPLADYGDGQAGKWRDAAFGLVITERLRAELAAVIGDDVAAAAGLAPMGIRSSDTRRARPYAAWDGSGDARIFSCGRLNPAKGHDTLIRAVSVLMDAGLPVRLAIAGEDEQGGAGYRRELEHLIDELGLGERVRLLGAVGDDVVRAHLEDAHVFALASRGEPLGVAIMEAMGAGLPVVVGDGGGVRELVDERTAALVTPGDPRGLADAVAALLADADRATAQGARARDRVRDRFTSEASARVLRDGVDRIDRRTTRPVRP